MPRLVAIDDDMPAMAYKLTPIDDEPIAPKRNFLQRNIIDPIRGNATEKLPEFSVGQLRVNNVIEPKQARGVTGGFALTSDVKAQKEIIQENIPNAQFDSDKNGNLIVSIPQPDGGTYRAYVNKPGLSGRDIGNVVVDSAPYAVLGGAVAPLGAALATGASVVGGGAISVAQDIGAQQFGSQQPVDLGKAAISGLASGAGELGARYISNLLSRGATDTAAQSAAANYTIDDLASKLAASNTREAQTLSSLGRYDAQSVAALNDRMAQRFGISPTRAQATQNLADLQAQEAFAKGARGRAAQDLVSDRLAQQQLDINQSPQITLRQLGIGDVSEVTKQRAAGNAFQEIQNRRDMLRQDVAGAYENAFIDAPSVPLQRLDELLPAAKGTVETVTRQNQLFPASYGMIDEIEASLKAFGEVGGTDAKTINVQLQEVDGLRKRLNQFIGAASNNADRRQASLIKEAFDDKLDEIFEQSVESGDPSKYKKLLEARALRTRMGELFEAGKGAGVGQKFIDKVLNDEKTPEQFANLFIGASDVGKNSAAPQILRQTKKILGADSTAFKSVQQMHFLHMVDRATNNGQVSPLKLSNQINDLVRKNPSYANELFSKEQIRALKDYAYVLQLVKPTAFNPSGTAYTAAREISNVYNSTMKNMGLSMGIAGDPSLIAAYAANKGRGLMQRAAAAKIVEPFMIEASQTPMTQLLKGAGVGIAVGQGSQEEQQ